MKRHIVAAGVGVLLSLIALTPAFGQTAEDKARIDYEAAKLALQQNQPEVALVKVEAVIAVLGEQPEVLCFAAQAALAAGEYDKANDYKQRAFAKADDKFKKSPNYQKLIEISARLELLADPEARQRDQEDRARRELLARGIAPSEEALRTAAQRGDGETVRLLGSAGVKPAQFKEYIEDAKIDDAMLRELVNEGAYVNADALCSYVRGSRQVVYITFDSLLKAVPTANVSCSEGLTSGGGTFLSVLAYHWEWADGIRLAVQRGADVNARNSLGNTALWEAAWMCHEYDVAALLTAGADPKIKDTNYKLTPLKAVSLLNGTTPTKDSPECRATRARLEKVK